MYSDRMLSATPVEAAPRAPRAMGRDPTSATLPPSPHNARFNGPPMGTASSSGRDNSRLEPPGDRRWDAQDPGRRSSFSGQSPNEPSWRSGDMPREPPERVPTRGQLPIEVSIVTHPKGQSVIVLLHSNVPGTVLTLGRSLVNSGSRARQTRIILLLLGRFLSISLPMACNRHALPKGGFSRAETGWRRMIMAGGCVGLADNRLPVADSLIDGALPVK